MASLHSLYEKGKQFFLSKKRRYLIVAILASFFLLLVIKGCKLSMLEAPRYAIGQDTSWNSLNLLGKERNLTAFNNDLLTQIGKKEHIQFHIYPTHEINLFKELEQGKLKGILTTVQPSPPTERHFIFSEPFFLTGPVLIIPQTSSTKGWNAIPQKIIAVKSNTPTLPELERDPTIQLRFYDDFLNALADLNIHRIDGAIIPAIRAYTYTKTFYANKLKVITPPLTREGIRLVVLKNAEGEQLIEQFNQGLESLKEEGLYTQLLNQWGFIDVEKIEE